MDNYSYIIKYINIFFWLVGFGVCAGGLIIFIIRILMKIIVRIVDDVGLANDFRYALVRIFKERHNSKSQDGER